MADFPIPSARGALRGLSCPSCGGTLDVAEGWTNLVCKYCDTPLALLGERGVLRLMVLDRLDRGQAEDTVRRWLSRGIQKAPALKREAKVEEAFLAWFPFVRLRFDLVGWILGVNVERVKRGNRWVDVEKPVELEIERSLERNVPAGEMAEFGVQRVDLAGDEILPMNEELLAKRGMVFRPTKAAPELARELADAVAQGVSRRSGPDRVTFSWLAPVRKRVSVLHYPLWVFRYSFRGRTYQVLVDAEGGQIAYGKAPGNHLYRAASLTAATAGACFLGTTFLQHAGRILNHSDNPLMILGVLGLAMTAMVSWGYRQFRHGGVVEEGTGLRAEEDLTGQSDEVAAKLISALEKLR